MTVSLAPPEFAAEVAPLGASRGGATADVDGGQPPVCPACRKRLVIIASRSGRDAAGAYVRRQLWGCPRGHATAEYVAGVFGTIEVLPEA